MQQNNFSKEKVVEVKVKINYNGSFHGKEWNEFTKEEQEKYISKWWDNGCVVRFIGISNK